MYNVAIHAQQVLGATILSVSLSETKDDGITYPLAVAMSSSNLLESADEDPLWIFIEQVRDAVSRALSTGDERPIWDSLIRDGVDGGWRGAGSSDGSERSEDPHA